MADLIDVLLVQRENKNGLLWIGKFYKKAVPEKSIERRVLLHFVLVSKRLRIIYMMNYRRGRKMLVEAC